MKFTALRLLGLRTHTGCGHHRDVHVRHVRGRTAFRQTHTGIVIGGDEGEKSPMPNLLTAVMRNS